MQNFSKPLMIIGTLCFVVGLFLHWGGKHFPIGKLPGDIVIEKENFKFYFPIVSSLLLSVIVSILFYLFRRRL